MSGVKYSRLSEEILKYVPQRMSDYMLDRTSNKGGQNMQQKYQTGSQIECQIEYQMKCQLVRIASVWNLNGSELSLVFRSLSSRIWSQAHATSLQPAVAYVQQ